MSLAAFAQDPGGPRGLAETATATPEISAEPAPPPARTSSAAPAGSAAWELYHEAALRLVDGDEGAARAALERLAASFPGQLAARRAAELLLALDERREPPPGASLLAPVPPPAAERTSRFGAPGREVESPSALARAELVVGQTLHGIALGAELCGALDCEDARAIAGLTLGGAAAGLGLSLWLSADGITPGHATLLNSGAMWGAWNGVALLGALTPRDFAQEAFAVVMAAQLAGLGAGQLAWHLLEPTAGDVSLANSSAIWSGVIVFLAHLATDLDASSQTVFATLLVATDLGLVAGVVAGRYFPMSRGRVLLIDAGGLLGGLAGVGIPLLIGGDRSDPGPVFGSGIAGVVLGLGVATFLSRHWDALELPVQVGLLPTEGGGMVALGGHF